VSADFWVPLLAGGFVFLMLGLQLSAWLGARRQRGRPAPDYAQWLPEALQACPRLLVYFHSPRCGPCRSMTPVIDELARHHAGVVKVDVADRPALAMAFGIRATPTVVLVADGTVREVLLGPQRRDRLEKLLDPPAGATAD